MTRRLRRVYCRRRGHDWFPNLTSEFLALVDVCLRCHERRYIEPWGTCLDGTHPIATHYRWDGETVRTVAHGECLGPR